ncbi:MAG: hypothetical protein KAS32_18025 [Candidatus Peribacteraceae bacterium]|nr:hypothetical protein [Candidatus Peribacteraceae bacterium]
MENEIVETEFIINETIQDTAVVDMTRQMNEAIISSYAIPREYITGVDLATTAAEQRELNNREATVNISDYGSSTTGNYTISNDGFISGQYAIKPNNYHSYEDFSSRITRKIDKLGSLDENEALALLDMLSAQNFHSPDCEAIDNEMLECTCDWGAYKDLIMTFIEKVLEGDD